MRNVRCKFLCHSVSKSKHWKQVTEPGKEFVYTAKFTAVGDGSPENKAFFDATPSGSIEVGTYTEDVFEVGRAYFVDFTPEVPVA